MHYDYAATLDDADAGAHVLLLFRELKLAQAKIVELEAKEVQLEAKTKTLEAKTEVLRYTNLTTHFQIHTYAYL